MDQGSNLISTSKHLFTIHSLHISSLKTNFTHIKAIRVQHLSVDPSSKQKIFSNGLFTIDDPGIQDAMIELYERDNSNKKKLKEELLQISGN